MHHTALALSALGVEDDLAIETGALGVVLEDIVSALHAGAVHVDALVGIGIAACAAREGQGEAHLGPVIGDLELLCGMPWAQCSHCG